MNKLKDPGANVAPQSSSDFDSAILARDAIRIPLNGKKPLLSEWQDLRELAAAARAALLYGHTGNTGLPCGHGRIDNGDETFWGVLVLDLDAKPERFDAQGNYRPEQRGPEVLAALEKELGPLPKTLTAITASGTGRHRYFEMPEEIEHVSNKVLDRWAREHGFAASGIEVQNEGHQVVFPGSVITPEYAVAHGYIAGEYRWEDATISIAKLPQAWVDFLVAEAARMPKRGERSTVDPVPLDPSTKSGKKRLARARKYLERAPLSIRGQGGRNVFFGVCVTLVRKMLLPHEVAADLIEEVYNPRLADAGTTKWSRSTPGPHGMTIMSRLLDAAVTSDAEEGRVETDKELDAWEAFRAARSKTPAESGTQLVEVPHGYECTYGETAIPDEQGTIGRSKVALVLSGIDGARWKDVLRWDVLRERVTAKCPPIALHAEAGDLSEDDGEHIAYWFSARLQKTVSTEVAFKVARAVAKKRPFNPLLEYFETLSPATGAIDELCDVLCQTDPLDRAKVRKTVLAAVRRAVRPGCKADTVLTLKGPPGKKKSAFVAALFGEEWISENLTALDRVKDLGEIMAGKWAICWDELEGSVATREKRDTSIAFITRRVDTFRAAYGRGNATPHPRCCVLIGTTNSAEIYRDADGADVRRFWVIEVPEKIDTARVREIRDAVWSEAYAATKADVWAGSELVAGEPHWLDDEQSRLHEQRAALYRDRSPLEPKVADYLAGKTEVESANVIAMHLAAGDVTKAKQLKPDVVKAMRDLGCKEDRRWHDKKTVRYYAVPEDIAARVSSTARVVPLRPTGR